MGHKRECPCLACTRQRADDRLRFDQQANQIDLMLWETDPAWYHWMDHVSRLLVDNDTDEVADAHD